MIVLGISETHCATAAVLRDGAIVGCASEERFSRLKNDAGYPRLAIDALLRELTLAPSAIDRVVLAGTRIPSYDWMNRVMRDPEYVRQYYAVRLDAPRRGLGGRARKLGAKLGLLDPAPGKAPLPERERRAAVTTHLGIDGDKVSIVDHHTCHAAAAYFGSPFAGAPALVLTNDNSGDGLCATASSAHGTLLERREATPSGPGSLGSFYTLVTLLLGMKPGEHEYKVMGLAPYATAGPTARATAALRTVFDFVEAQPCRFEWKKRGPLYRAVLEATLGMRFDWIAGGAQRILEESLLGWARLMRERHGGERLALGGGVFMNVKANMLLADEPWAADLFVFPSCGDESNAVGAAYLGYVDLCARQGIAPAPRPFGPAYLGPGIDDAEVEAAMRRRDLAARHRVSEPARMEERIAELLASDGVVARARGGGGGVGWAGRRRAPGSAPAARAGGAARRAARVGGGRGGGGRARGIRRAGARERGAARGAGGPAGGSGGGRAPARRI